MFYVISLQYSMVTVYKGIKKRSIPMQFKKRLLLIDKIGLNLQQTIYGFWVLKPHQWSAYLPMTLTLILKINKVQPLIIDIIFAMFDQISHLKVWSLLCSQGIFHTFIATLTLNKGPKGSNIMHLSTMYHLFDE